MGRLSDNPMRRYPVKPHISENCAVPTKENYGTMHKLQILNMWKKLSHITALFVNNNNKPVLGIQLSLCLVLKLMVMKISQWA